jgi:hypothetical protein
MSSLQAHILLKITNDVLGYLTTLDDDFCLAAAGYAEALALSNYCYEQVTTLTKSEGTVSMWLFRVPPLTIVAPNTSKGRTACGSWPEGTGRLPQDGSKQPK